jgi:ribulose-phosphate 3-epimerase
MPHLVSPSILTADFANLKNEIGMLNDSAADWIHVDVMDGVFVPNITFGFPLIEAIAAHSKKPLDVHLMIVQPERYIEQFRDAGAALITVHYEACQHLHRVVQQVKEAGCRVGVALNPHTNVNVLEDIIHELDLVLLMSVNPGFGGQAFIPQTIEKVRKLRALAEGRNSSLYIEIDGGVSRGNAPALINAGATVLVAGNAVFSSDDPVATIAELKNMNPAILIT